MKFHLTKIIFNKWAYKKGLNKRQNKANKKLRNLILQSTTMKKLDTKSLYHPFKFPKFLSQRMTKDCADIILGNSQGSSEIVHCTMI